MSPANIPPPDLLHKLVWHNQYETLDAILGETRGVTIVDAESTTVVVSFIDIKYRGTTALGLAAQLGHSKCVQVLLKHWADTLTLSEIGYYPLQEATSLGDRDIIRMILLRRHEQLRQLWKIRQPSLANALHHELPDFFLEMDWHFRSWIPFLSRLCPSDTCRIWKCGNKLRVDSTLMGVEVEKLNWMRGNISFIFHVNETSSQMFALDHDKKLYEEIDKMRDFTDEEIEEDITLRLNTQIYSGKMRKPKDDQGRKHVIFHRQQAGLFGLGGDKEEQIGPYKTRVYDVPDIEAVARYRKEHLVARMEIKERPLLPLANDDSSDDHHYHYHSEDTSNSSLESEKVLADIEGVEPQVESLLNDARRNLFVYVPSLERPRVLPSVGEAEYFPTNQGSGGGGGGGNNPLPLPYMHAGRPLIQSQKSKKFRVSVWMADNFPLTVQQLLPFIEIMTQGNKNFEKLQDFISMDLPPGFPVRIEIPLFAFLAAQITFSNFKYWKGGVGVPTPQFAPANINDWFKVPKDYKSDIVIKSILKDNN